MEREEIKDTIESYEKYITVNGIDEVVISAYTKAAKYVLTTMKEREYGLQLTARVKDLINELCKEKSSGDIWELEKYCYAHKVSYRILDLYFQVLLLEAQNKVLDSYLLYLEKKRNPRERFYAPKRKQFMKIGLIQALQDMLDDKLDILSMSLPPGTGKAQPLDAKVLTPNGFVRMGDIKVGDKVIAGNGNVSEVLGVFPQGKKPIYRVTLDDGSCTEVSDEHLWYVRHIMDCSLKVNPYEYDVVTTNDLLNPVVYEIPKAVRVTGEQYPRLVEDLSWQEVLSVQYIGEKECQCIYISDPCHLYITDDYIITHNTTLEKFFHSGLMGWNPKHFSLFYSHSSDITRMYFEGVLNILTDTQEYTWGEIFPNVYITNTNAKLEQINVGNYKPFPNLQTTSVGSKNAGKVRCNYFLLVDDMIGGIEEALNKNILDKLWDKYAVDARQRKIQDNNGIICKEIHIATRWSVHDVIGRLQRAYEGNNRARFIAVPDIDPETGESNFDYEYNGFSVEFFNDQAKLMDEISYRCLYKNDPIEREGLLYHDDDLRRFITLPEREPDAILGVCDTKNKGTDFMVMPVMYQYGEDYYMVDCICDDSANYGLQYSRLANMILDHKMQQVEFESNSGGDRVAHEVAKLVAEGGGRCNITTKPTETNKETRIIVNSDWVKKNVLFKDSELYQFNSDYGRFMRFLLSYSLVGKNEHDDVPDCIANFAKMTTKEARIAKIEAIRNPLRGGWYS